MTPAEIRVGDTWRWLGAEIQVEILADQGEHVKVAISADKYRTIGYYRRGVLLGHFEQMELINGGEND